ncbi:5' DNA nuclease [Metarhizobium album]|uniref:5' DNA nuclease n=1 Tax=Metarhizobium album TaxID=2182425 RepID=A0A2U2DHV8_9HYPH|nr:5' DNA nuclease [Rhizobium album]PWE52864.1 5' DNA nuclease [Rhizobium album]
MTETAGKSTKQTANDTAGTALPPLHPFAAHPAAAFAAAATIGFGFSTQMAGAFLGALQSAVETSQRFSALLEKQMAEGQGAAVKVEPVVKEAKPVVTRTETAKVVPLKPVLRAVEEVAPVVETKAKPVVKTVSKEKVKSAVTAKAAPKAKQEKPVIAAPVKTVRRAKADDLKRISGIGPKLEQVLNGKGVSRFADIAGWSEDDIKRFDAELGVEGRIGRDDWIGQAKALAGTKTAKT